MDWVLMLMILIGCPCSRFGFFFIGEDSCLGFELSSSDSILRSRLERFDDLS